MNLKIGDKYSQGIITDMEKDENKVFWIEITYPTGGKNRIHFKRTIDTIEREKINKVCLTLEEYTTMNENYKRVTEENTKLIAENIKLKSKINDMLNAKV